MQSFWALHRAGPPAQATPTGPETAGTSLVPRPREFRARQPHLFLNRRKLVGASLPEGSTKP